MTRVYHNGDGASPATNAKNQKQDGAPGSSEADTEGKGKQKNKKQIPKAKPKPLGEGMAVANGGHGVSRLIE